jgi:hypothetical protein
MPLSRFYPVPINIDIAFTAVKSRNPVQLKINNQENTMKKLFGIIFALTIVTGMLATGCCPWGYVVGTGPIVEKTFNYKDFTDIEISSAIEYEINQTSDYSVEVSTHENILDRLDIRQSGKTLIVRLKPGSYTHSDVRVTVNLPAITRLDISGASRGKIGTFKTIQNFEMQVSGASQADMQMECSDADIEISGASKVRGNLIANNLYLTVSGASRCNLEGSAVDGDIIVSGASQIEFGGFRLKNIDIVASGASRADIYTDGELSLDISGASTLSYSGKPTLNKINISGASKIVTN